MGSSSHLMWIKLYRLRARVKHWQSYRYSATLTRSKEFEAELAGLLRQPLPQNMDELDSFVARKRELDL